MAEVSDVGNPISVIKNKLHMLRKEKDATEADIESLQHEKAAIRSTLPKLLHVLIQHRDNIAAQNREMMILDKAIAEIEDTYGHILYSPDFYDNGDGEEYDNGRGRGDRGGGRGGRGRKGKKNRSDDGGSGDESASETSSAARAEKKRKEKQRNRKYKVF
jgi:hypothetical protein